MISLETARMLLDFRGATRSISKGAAEEQLRGAVALRNILEQRRVAYLADEVGMGKTYVALGAMALFRHFNPHFRLLVIAPRENIQRKWIKELRNFVRNNVRFSDLRVKALHGAPARPTVACHNLVELIRETSLNPNRDFFARLTSFSLPLGSDPEGWKRRRDELLQYLPWANPEDFDLRARDEFKDNFARAVCAALPMFDLVIVDEGHNLKHGFGQSVAARNRVLGLSFGHPSDHPRGFPGYSPRARRVLFLSATPLENDYAQLWNQLNVFGFGDVAPELNSKECSDEEKRACAQQFLIRRVTSMTVAGRRLTKNLYRREWRNGGVTTHDEPLGVPEERQRLVVALVQKKVSEVLGHERFNNSFQIGMLASFESFLETAKVKTASDGEEESAFDDPNQTQDLEERQGLDVGTVNQLARSYSKAFGEEMPHPKMDALVERLAAGLSGGSKALVFVRRVASVKELQAKLEDRYDQWLISRLRSELPSLASSLDRVFAEYRQERARGRRTMSTEPTGNSGELEEDGTPVPVEKEGDDTGGIGTFFAWFFRGEGPREILSGAALQRRFIQASSTYSTYFEDNHVAWLLGVQPGKVLQALGGYLHMPADALRRDLIARVEPLLPAGRRDHRIERLHLFLALQEAALSVVRDRPGPLRERARVILQSLPSMSGAGSRGANAPAEAERWLEAPTFFSELRNRRELSQRLWPKPSSAMDFRLAFRERELRRLLLSATARLGHAFIDLYVVAVRRIGSLRLRAREEDDDAGSEGLIRAHLDLLESQMREQSGRFHGFRELASGAKNFNLILDVNAPDLRNTNLSLSDAVRMLGTLLGRQQPIGGMFGTINQTLVRQFRMPGYPLVLVTTDLLQEGEDLHPFCSSVYHYGISWMPSSMEQRVGRIDRVNSESERRLVHSRTVPSGEDLLQVFYPHLRDTVEVLQVGRVLERMNRFMRLMHKNLGQPEGERRQINVAEEILRPRRDIEPIREVLSTAFPVRKETLKGASRHLAVAPEITAHLLERFRRLKKITWPNLAVRWETEDSDEVLRGAVGLKGGHKQPFVLRLHSFDGRLLVHCFSPLGWQEDGDDVNELAAVAFDMPVKVDATRDDRRRGHELEVKSDVLLGKTEEQDAARVAYLIGKVILAAVRLETVLRTDSDHDLTELAQGVEVKSDHGADWKKLSRRAGLRVIGDEILLKFGKRQQRVSVDQLEHEGSLRLWSLVAKPSAMSWMEDPSLYAWGRNRTSDLVGYKVDRRGRLIGESWVLAGGLGTKEWSIYVNTLARSCDRLEYLLTGRDE